MNIGHRTFEEYLSMVEDFHGYAAPGLLIGGYMVEAARRAMPPGVLYDAVSETKSCLPDAIQLLTPCTVGNGWLRVFNLGRYALTLYDKHEGQGVRVWLDADKLRAWPHIYTWFFILAKKSEQDASALQDQIRQAGDSLCSLRPVRVRLADLRKKRKDRIALCPLCREAYPPRDGAVCRGCQGEAPYEEDFAPDQAGVPALRAVPAAEAVGLELVHDMTRIVPGESKGPAFLKGQRLGVGDLCRLQQMGRSTVFVREPGAADDPAWVHEDEAALAFARAMAGEGVRDEGPPREGKINLVTDRDGLFLADEKRMEAFNLLPGVVVASRQGNGLVEAGMRLAGTRAIPLHLPRTTLERALAVLGEEPLFSVVPLRRARAGLLVTGTEVATGVIQDRFVPILTAKLEKLGSSVAGSLIVPDDREAIARGLGQLLDAGADLIVTTAGLSVDPDDVTRQALGDAGLKEEVHGMPVLPGAMTLLGRVRGVRLIGVPACALFFKTTSFDLLLPRILADQPLGRAELARMGHGGLCLECKTCTHPKCSFGK